MSETTPSTIPELLDATRAWYAEHAPAVLGTSWLRITPATEAELAALEREMGTSLPADYRDFLARNDIKHGFSGNFGCLSCAKVLHSWRRMTQLLREGAFDDGRIEHHVAQGFGNWDSGEVRQVWWSTDWVPFAEDGCGNMHCLDGAPGPRGVRHQVIAMEVQDGQGPFPTANRSFTAYLANHLRYLRNGQFEMIDDLPNVDRHMKPRPPA